MILAGDIGGTKTVLALFDGDNEEPGRPGVPRLVERATYPSREWNGLSAIATEFLRQRVAADSAVQTAYFGVAGPVIEGRSETINLPWVLDTRELSAELGIPSVGLMNDLVATAEGVPFVSASETATLQVGDPPRQAAPRALAAAGTGLGMAILVPQADGWQVLASEGGHADWAPRTRDEMAFLDYLLERHPDHVSVERAVCGPALLTLYQFLVSRGGAPVPEVEQAIQTAPDTAVAKISSHGLAGDSPVCVEVLDRFCRMYGAVAGNLALTCLAMGGLWLGGGVSSRLAGKLAEGAFIEAFRAKGRFTSLMERVPVKVILNPDAALWGAARRAWVAYRSL